MYVKVILLACQNPSIYRKSDLIYNSKRMARRVRECVQGGKYDFI